MAARTSKKPKASAKKADAMRDFRMALASGDPSAPARAYIFHGEESYLREYYLNHILYKKVFHNN